MAIAFVQSVDSAVNQNSGTGKAYTSNVTAGNFLFMAGRSTAILTGSGVTDNLNGAWTQLVNVVIGAQVLFAYYFPNTLGGACTITVTNGGANLLSWTQAEFSGVKTVSPLDQTGASTNGTGTAVTATSITPTSGGQLVIAGVGNSAGTQTLSAGGGFNVLGNTNKVSALIYQIQTTASASAPNGTYGGSVTWEAQDWSFLAGQSGIVITHQQLRNWRGS